jgi:hypothetical protein
VAENFKWDATAESFSMSDDLVVNGNETVYGD